MRNMTEQQPDMPQKKGFSKWFPLLILSLALTIIILDTTILNVSLRTIINDLHTDIQSIQWVITAYSLILAAFTITGGRLGDLFGRKRMFATGAIIFAIGSFVTSISTSVGMMITGEAVIEGFGAALMMPATSSLLVSNYKGRDRQIGFGIWGGIAAGAAALGPVVGGWLTTYFSWRWAFRINVFVAALLVIGSFFINEARDIEEKPSLDFIGIFLSALGMLAVVFGFIQSSSYGWLVMKETTNLLGITLHQGNISPVPFFIIAGLIILCLFALWEDYICSKDKTPLVNLQLFTNSQFTLGVTIIAIMSLSQSGLSFALPVFLQSVKHLNALNTGFAMLPMTLTLLVAAPFSALISKYIAPKRIIQAGLILDAAGFLLLRAGIEVNATQWALVPGFILFGIGMGCMMSQVSNVTLSAVSISESGEASGVNGTMRQVGATLGSAIMGAVLISVLSTNLVSGVKQSAVIPEQMKPAISNAVSQQTSNIEFGSGPEENKAQLPAAITEEITKISQQATVDSTHTTLLLGSIIILIALIVSVKLPGGKNIERERSIAVGH